MSTHDLIVVGAGPGGYTLALDAARRGMKTALVEERKNLGGVCLNEGCIPSKALLESSELYHRIKVEAAVHGIKVSKDGAVLDLPAMMARKKSVVDGLTGGIAALMRSRRVDVVHGRGVVTSAGNLRVESHSESQTLTAPRIVLATGSTPVALPGMPFDGKRILSSTDALSLTRPPKSLAVIGAGAVGLELGSVWSRLGAEVTVLEAMDHIVPGADAQATSALSNALKKQGMQIQTGVMVEKAEVTSRGVSLAFKTRADDGGAVQKLKVDQVLLAVGRRAVIDSVLDDSVKPKRTEDGRFLEVDEHYATSIDGLYAIGDVVGNPMLAHKAGEEALALAAIFAGELPPPWGGPIPGIVYTDPELAWAGESEDSLKKAGKSYAKGYFPFAANGRSLAADSGTGFAKLLSDPEDNRLLGAVLLGRGTSELIAEAVLVMAMGGAAEDIALTVHAHPTRGEAVREAALSLAGRPLHRG